MPVLSSPSTWRTHPFWSKGFLAVIEPDVVFAASVNMTDVSYPVISLTYDAVSAGAYASIKPGMTLMLGSAPGLDDLGRQRVRAAATGSAIPIGRTSRGFHRGELNILDNSYITVLNLYEVWTKTPFITPAGVQYKDEIAFSAGIAQPPIANGGPAVCDFVDPDTGLLTRNFTAALSVIMDASASVLTFAWDFADGTPSSATTEVVTGVTFPAGYRYVSLTVYDGTRNHTTRILVYAANKTTFAPIPVEASTRVLNDGGQEFTVVFKRPLSHEAFPRGTAAIYCKEEHYGSHKGSLAGRAGRENVKFVGWLGDEETEIRADRDGLHKRVTIPLMDVGKSLAAIPAYPQTVTRKIAPANWYQMANLDIDRFFHYTLHWHSTALEVAPVTLSGAGSTYYVPVLNSKGETIYEQVASRAFAIGYLFTCNQNGELAIWPEPLRRAERTAVVVVDLAETDWSFVRYIEHRSQFRWWNGSAIVPSTTASRPVFAIAPGPTPGQGVGTGGTAEQIATQFELRQRTGYDYARANNPQGVFEIELTHSGDAGIEPAIPEWITFSISAAVAAQRGVTIEPGERFLTLQATISENDAGVSRVRIQLEREPDAILAVKVKPPTGTGGSPPSIPSAPSAPTYPTLPEDPAIILPPDYPALPPVTIYTPTIIPSDGGTALIVMSDGTILLSQNLVSAAPTFLDITPALPAGWRVTHAVWSGFGQDVYAIANNGVGVTQLYYAPSAGGASWTGGVLLTGLYDEIKLTATQGHVYAHSTRPTTGYYQDTLETALGLLTRQVSATYNFGLWDANVGGVYQATGGRGAGVDGCIAGQNVGSFSGFDRYDATVVVDFGVDTDILGVGLWHKASVEGKTRTLTVKTYDASKVLINTVISSAPDTTTYWAHTVKYTQSSGVRYVVFGCEMKVTDGQPFLDDLEITYKNTYTDKMALALGLQTVVCSATYPFGFWTTNAGGAWTAAGGRDSDGCVQGVNVGNFGGFDRYDASIVVDLGAEGSVVVARCYQKASANAKARTCRIDAYDGSKAFIATLVTAGGTSTTTWTALTTALAQPRDGVRYLVFVNEMKVADGQPFLDDLMVEYTVANDVVYSSDGFVADANYLLSGVREDAAAGFDTIKVGVVGRIAGRNYVRGNASDGGDFADVDLITYPRRVTALAIPHYAIGSATVENTGATPDYVRFSASTSPHLQRVQGGVAASMNAPNAAPNKQTHCIVLPWWSGKVAVVAAVQTGAGTVGVNGDGAVYTTPDDSVATPTWTRRTPGILTSAPMQKLSPIGGYLTMRRGDSAMQQIWVTDQDIFYSSDFGVNWIRITIPGSSENYHAKSIEIYG